MKNKFMCEVPRFFSEIFAENLEEAKEKLAAEATIVAKKYATVEDVTNKEFPSAKEALTAKDDTLLNRIVNIFESGKSITKATGATTFLGIGGGDVLFNSGLCKSLGIASEEELKTDMFVSFGGYLSNSIKDTKTA
jgi:hypothetical protein